LPTISQSEFDEAGPTWIVVRLVTCGASHMSGRDSPIG
jgi:hypothetical protein